MYAEISSKAFRMTFTFRKVDRATFERVSEIHSPTFGHKKHLYFEREKPLFLLKKRGFSCTLFFISYHILLRMRKEPYLESANSAPCSSVLKLQE